MFNNFNNLNDYNNYKNQNEFKAQNNEYGFNNQPQQSQEKVNQGAHKISNNFLTTQNCRLDIIGELDVINQYERHLAETDDPTAKATIQDIVNEEKLHVGQLMGLLFYLDPSSKTQFEKGFNEFINNDRR